MGNSESAAATQHADRLHSDDLVHAESQGKRFHVALAYLRAFIIVLVVAYHAALPYNPIVSPEPATSLSEHLQTMRAISPVNDAQRSELLSLFTAFNDTFLMALMFLLSGLFVWHSLQRKGGAGYLRGRLIRLGIPLIAMVLLRPLTYYPTYLQSGGDGGPLGFWQAWSEIAWRGGPIWFLEVLLAFDIVVVVLVGLGLDWGAIAERLPWALPRHPSRALAVLIVLSFFAYVPLTLAYGSFFWLQIGPAQIQMNRLLYYAVYFMAGILLGAYGIDRSFLAEDSGLSRRWAVWALLAGATFFAYIVAAVGGRSEVSINTLFVLTSTVTSFALIAMFLRFARKQRPVLDSLFHNSYGIYIVHYGVVSALSFALLGAAMPAMAKFLIGFFGSLAACWALVAALRRIPVLDRVL